MRYKASDLHIAVGLPPVLRVHGRLLQTPYEPLTPEDTRRMADQFLTKAQQHSLKTLREFDFNYFSGPLHVFRASFFHDRGTIAGAFRLLSRPIPTIASLEIPPVIENLCGLTSGLILVTGATGSGKNELVAAMIDSINSSNSRNIVAIEDRTEYFHPPKLSVIRQREIGQDVLNVAAALCGLRSQDADVVVVETLRDLETMRTALALASNGRLVFASIATVSAASTVDRLIESFPENEQDAIRLDLSNSLQAVLCTQLIPNANGIGKIMAQEIMIVRPEIREMIRQSMTDRIPSFIESQDNHDGMQTMAMSLRDLYLAGRITRDMAIARSMNRIEMEGLLSRTDEKV
ncbi:MAG: PilT/PilU family type 4a pilus ATPase [Akkermansiaceae bacterium]|nr:PilT/PilU family type 4a pilus ATPase [Armatimonadota bacterium]